MLVMGRYLLAMELEPDRMGSDLSSPDEMANMRSGVDLSLVAVVDGVEMRVDRGR